MKTFHAILCILAASLLLPSASACLSYGYTVDVNTGHRSLFTSNAVHFGEQASVVTDCPNGTVLYVNGEAYLSTSNIGSVPLPLGVLNLSLEDESGRTDFVNAHIVGADVLFTAISQNPNLAPKGENDFTNEELSTHEVLVAIGSFVIIYAAVVGYHWRKVSEEVDTTLFMEVQ